MVLLREQDFKKLLVPQKPVNMIFAVHTLHKVVQTDNFLRILIPLKYVFPSLPSKTKMLMVPASDNIIGSRIALSKQIEFCAEVFLFFLTFVIFEKHAVVITLTVFSSCLYENKQLQIRYFIDSHQL